MAETPNPGEPLAEPQVRTIRQLVKLMQRFDLTAVDLDNGQTRIRLRRRGAEPGPPAPPAVAPAQATTPNWPTAPPAATPLASATAPEAPSSSRGVFIESPMVGTFYLSPSPDAPPFVTVGSVVRPETPVCVIEAMKVFTDIPAGVSGTIAEILAQSGQPVEFGQPLFRVTEQ